MSSMLDYHTPHLNTQPYHKDKDKNKDKALSSKHVPEPDAHTRGQCCRAHVQAHMCCDPHMRHTPHEPCPAASTSHATHATTLCLMNSQYNHCVDALGH
jgi:hypothetical protein